MNDKIKLGILSVRDDTSITEISGAKYSDYIFSTRDDPSKFGGNESSDDLILLYENDDVDWDELNRNGQMYMLNFMPDALHEVEADRHIINVPSSIAITLDNDVFTVPVTMQLVTAYYGSANDFEHMELNDYPFLLAVSVEGFVLAVNDQFNKIIIKSTTDIVGKIDRTK